MNDHDVGFDQGTEWAAEQKSERFVRLAKRRVTKALKMIGLIGNLSEPSRYEWEREQQIKIFTALRKHIDEAEARFNAAHKDHPQLDFDL